MRDKKWLQQTALFLASQQVSLFGSSIVQYAITWYITLETQSGAMMAISILANMLPALIMSPFAGVWADRYNRKTLMILADTFIALATLAMALIFPALGEPIAALFVLTAIRAFGSAVHMPAVSAFLPQIVPSDKLMRVNGINGSLSSATMLLSPIVSGALLGFMTLSQIFWIDVVTATIAILILLAFVASKPVERESDAEASGYWKEIKAGVGYVRSHRYLFVLFSFLALFFFVVAPIASLTPLQVTRTYGPDVWRLTAIEVAFFIGMLAGSLLISVWGGFKNRIHTIMASSLLCGVFTMVLAFAPLFWIYCVFMALTGLVIPFFSTPITTILQERVENRYLGRVFSINRMLDSIVMPLAIVFFGPLADRVAIEGILFTTAPFMLIMGLMLLKSQSLLDVGLPPVLVEQVSE